jgi:hypothetical protein
LGKAVVDTPAVVCRLGHIWIKENSLVVLETIPILKTIAAPSKNQKLVKFIRENVIVRICLPGPTEITAALGADIDVRSVGNPGREYALPCGTFPGDEVIAGNSTPVF